MSSEYQYPIRLSLVSRMNFLYTEIEDDDGIPTLFRYTTAYRTVGMEQDAPDHDPCFVVQVAFAFCNELADQFSRSEGRELARKRLQTERPMDVRLYAGSCFDIQYAVERAWTRKSFADLCSLHVPRRLARWFRLSDKAQKRPAMTSEQRTHREYCNAIAQASRSGYTAAIQAGKTHDEAVLAAKAAVVERMR